jgi:hypothetical protein
MKNTKRVATLVDTLSVRFPPEMFMRLVAASTRERRTLSDYVRLLVEERQRQQTAPPVPVESRSAAAAAHPPLSFEWFRKCE